MWEQTSVLARSSEVPMASGDAVRFLELLDAPAADALSRCGVVRHLCSEQVVLLQGEVGGRVAVVERGIVKITATSVDGRSRWMEIRGSGDAVGLVESLVGGPRSSTVTCAAPSVLRMLSSGEYAELLHRFPSVQAAAVRVVAGRLREATAERPHLGDAVPIRLAHSLLRLAREHGRVGTDGALHVELSLSQDELATMISSSRDSVAKTLVTWRRQGLVATSRRSITVLDPDGLGAVR